MTIDGPREIADVRDAFGWLAARPDVADNRIGAWGISYGGGARLERDRGRRAVRGRRDVRDVDRSLLRPRSAESLEVRRRHRLPLPRSHRACSHRRSRPSGRGRLRRPTCPRFDCCLTSGRRSRTSPRVTTPVFMMQGRRDFAFGIDQATRAYSTLAGPKALWIGNHGHAPSSFPAADTAADDDRRQDVVRPPSPRPAGGHRASPCAWRARGTADAVGYSKLPATKTVKLALPGQKTIVQATKLVRPAKPTTSAMEVFGRPAVKVTATAAGGWARLVAVLTARTPAGKEIVVSAGGLPTTPGRRTYTIRMIDQATFVPKGSRFSVTVASSSSAQNPANLLYLDLPMVAGARVTLGPIDCEHPCPHEGDLGMKLASVLLAAAVIAVPGAFAADPGRLLGRDRHRRHGADLGARVRVRSRRPGREGVLRLRERERRRVRPRHPLPLPRRRVRPGADDPADATARRAGARVRDLQRRRHRAHARHTALPQPARRPAAVRGQRRVRARPRRRPSTRGRWATSPASSPRDRFYGRHIAKTRPGATIAVLYEDSDFGKDLLRGLRKRPARQGQGRRHAGLRGDRGRRLVADRRAAGVEGEHADDLRAAQADDPVLHRRRQARLAAEGHRRRGVDRPVRHERGAAEHETTARPRARRRSPSSRTRRTRPSGARTRA